MEASEQELNTTRSKQTALNKSGCSCSNWDYINAVDINQKFTAQKICNKSCGILEVEYIITQTHSEST